MKKLWIVLLILMFAFPSAIIAGPTSPKSIAIQEVDGDPKGYVRKLIFPNASLTVTGGTGIYSYSGAGVATDFALTADADAGDHDIKSIDGLYGVDDLIYIDLGTDGALTLEADTMVNITSPLTVTGALLFGTDTLTSAELLDTLSDETGTGVAVFATSPTFTTSATIQGASGAEATLDIVADAGEDNNDTWQFAVTDGGGIYFRSYESGAYLSAFAVLPGGGTYVYGKDDTDPALLNLYADIGTDNSDKWRFSAADGGDLTTETYQSGAWVAAATLTNAGALTISALTCTDCIDSANMNWAEPITAPFDNKFQFGDTGIYIFADDDGILDIVADTSVDISNLLLATNASFGNYDITLADKISGFDANNFIDFGADGRLVIQADGAGTAFSTPDVDITGSVYFDDDVGLLLDKAVQFGDANVFIESDDDGYLDLDADTGIRLNQDVAIAGTLALTPTATPNVTFNDSDDSNDDVAQISGNALDVNDGALYLKVEVDNAAPATFITLDGAGETVDFAKPLDMGANAIASTGGIATTGIISGGSQTPVSDDADDFDDTGPDIFSGANLYGGTFIANGTGIINLPSVAVGMNFTVITLGAIAVTINPDDANQILADGVLLDNGDALLNGSTAGDIAVCQYLVAGDWVCTTNGWTDAS